MLSMILIKITGIGQIWNLCDIKHNLINLALTENLKVKIGNISFHLMDKEEVKPMYHQKSTDSKNGFFWHFKLLGMINSVLMS